MAFDPRWALSSRFPLGTPRVGFLSQARRAWSRGAAIALASLLGSSLGLAHDFWIEPATFRPARATLLEVRLRVGDHGRGENLPRNEARIVRFELVDDTGAKPVVGRDGQEIAGFARVADDGAAIVAYASNHAFVEIDATTFERYLREKGLDDVARTRERRGERLEPAKELYSRSAKALIAVGGSSDGIHDRELGLPLELIVESDPRQTATTGDAKPEVVARLVFRGAPLPGALVTALRLDGPPADADAAPIAGRTDADGRVRLRLGPGGTWLLASVHMIAASENARGASWESFWSSSTFVLEAAGAGAQGSR